MHPGHAQTPPSVSASRLKTRWDVWGYELNYYKKHIGDYATRTRTLSVTQHGIFSLLLDHYYTEEGPITTADANAICQARTAKERAAVMEILRRYFDEEPDGRWRNERCDAEIADYLKVVQKNRSNGSKNVPRETSPQAMPDGKPLGMPLGSQTASQTEPSHPHYPSPIKKKTDLSGKPDLPPDFVAWYSAYPRHEAKDDAERAWVKRAKAGELPPIADLLAAIEWQKKSGCLQPLFADGRSLIPLPATYLNKGKFKDEPPKSAESVKTCYLCGARATKPGPLCDPHYEHEKQFQARAAA